MHERTRIHRHFVLESLNLASEQNQLIVAQAKGITLEKLREAIKEDLKKGKVWMRSSNECETFNPWEEHYPCGGCKYMDPYPMRDNK